MPDSPVPSSIAAENVPIVSSPGQLHISTSASQLSDGRPDMSVATGLPNGYHASSPSQPLSPGLLNGKAFFLSKVFSKYFNILGTSLGKLSMN